MPCLGNSPYRTTISDLIGGTLMLITTVQMQTSDVSPGCCVADRGHQQHADVVKESGGPVPRLDAPATTCLSKSRQTMSPQKLEDTILSGRGLGHLGQLARANSTYWPASDSLSRCLWIFAR